MNEMADRVWTAARDLDALRGDNMVSEWTGDRVHELLVEGRADDPEAIRPLAEALEERLVRERRKYSKNSEAAQTPQSTQSL